MDTFKTFISEAAAEPGTIPSEAAKAVQKIERELHSILGSRYVVKAVYSSNLGKAIHLRVHDDKPANNIAHNSPVFMQFMMFLSSNSGRDIPLEKVSWEMSQGPRAVPFRKITSARSIEDATSKLIQWFKTNKQNLDGLLK